jgi:hypothetical protein
MKQAHITFACPLPDNATQEDAQALGELLVHFGLNNGDPHASLKPTGLLLRVELVEGARLGSAGAANLIDQMRTDPQRAAVQDDPRGERDR